MLRERKHTANRECVLADFVVAAVVIELAADVGGKFIFLDRKIPFQTEAVAITPRKILSGDEAEIKTVSVAHENGERQLEARSQFRYGSVLVRALSAHDRQIAITDAERKQFAFRGVFIS